MITFEEINQSLPVLLEALVNSDKNFISTLTRAKIEGILETRTPVAGVYLISESNGDIPVYVGRSGSLAQRIGKDHRATQQKQATLGYKLTTLKIPDVICMLTAREYMYKTFNFRMLPVPDEHTRTIFEIYASMKLATKYNSFMEH
jgi:hypothetical protein